MVKKIYAVLILVFLSVGLPVTIAAQKATVIKGLVRDSITQEPIPYASVFFVGSDKGLMTDDEGKFAVSVRDNFLNVRVSTLGYREKTFFVKKGEENDVLVELVPSDYVLEEVVVKPKREKYSRKNNPAVEFVKKLIERRHVGDPKNHDFYNYEKYEKMTFALNEFSEEQKKKWLFKKFQFIFDYVDTSEVSGKPILTVSIKEKIANNYYRRSPETEKTVVTGIKRAGIDEIFNEESVQMLYDDLFREIDIFGNDITLLSNRFVSPLSNIATSFYKYYLLDTIQVDGVRCIDLGFVPFNSESFGFTGHIYVPEGDSTYFIKKVKMNVPRDINLNYVENMYLEQDYERLEDGTRIKVKDDAIIEFEVLPSTQGLYARRMTTYSKFSFTPPDDLSVYDFEGRERVEVDAQAKPEEFWVDNRHVPVRKKENAVDKLLARLREVPVFYYTEKVLGVLIGGYIETGENSKFDFGPMNTTISANEVEGARFRVGGLTTAQLSPHWFARGYVAYGTKDEKVKYSGEVEYSFNKKKFHAKEFPINSIKLSHSYDIDQLGQQYMYTNKDNVFLSLKRKSDNKATYLRKTELSYLQERQSGFSFGLGIRNEIQQMATDRISFVDGYGKEIKDYMQTNFEVKLRYAPNEKFYQTKSNRFPINLDAPVFTLSHVFSFKDFLGSRYSYNRTEFGVQKRFWFSAFGYFDAIIKAGKVWDKVPFPMLILPNANLSYTIQPESYALMNALEFINDQYVSWDFTYNANGALFNRIPLLKYLKLREVFTFRGLYGSLSKKNNPLYNSDLFVFPKGSTAMDKMPYMECSVGLDNIFTILRVDYVWRLTYLDRPNISKSGVRIALHFTF